MAKIKKEVTRTDRIEKSRTSLKEAPTATKVKAWTFQVEKQHYVVLSYFAPRYGDQIDVYPSNRKGLKTTKTPIVHINNSTNYELGFEKAIEILIPENIDEIVA